MSLHLSQTVAQSWSRDNSTATSVAKVNTMTELRTVQDFKNLSATPDWGPTLVEELTTRQHDDGLNALLFVANPDQAFGCSGVLAGLPILIKDNIDTHDLPTTAGSYALSLNPPTRDATVVSRLREAGATIIGKTNLSEWANFRGISSVSGWSGRGGITRNPHDSARTAGGSSSGSAVAVAAGYVPVAIGTETDGSILCPAAVSGVVGFKSTPGDIDRTGVIPLSSTQDSVGIFANRVGDARLVAEVVVDSTHEALRPNYVVVESMLANLNPKTITCFEETLTSLTKHGYSITRLPKVSDGSLEPDEEAEQIVLVYEMSVELDRYLRDRNDATSRSIADVTDYNVAHPDQEFTFFGQELLTMGLTHPWEEASYRKALDSNRERCRKGIEVALAEADADILLAPTMDAAWLIDTINGDPMTPGNWSVAAVAGCPSLTLPIGSLAHMPIGMTMISRPHTDLALLGQAETIQLALDRL